ncbi:TetR/AcrR family transcriptional regulator [Methylobacterium oryzisoli]|uniref:TetR/AcrR family transcriptional regulator n=1 Tax=Methylobacterium oryzisoli TaxID=3385502 RepID=UPI003891C269
MKVTREQVAENRRRILAAAGRLFRERGFDAVSVAEVMRAAGLTHGGFYGYFRSKDDLIAAALAELVVAPPVAPLDPGRYAEQYLTPTHRDDRAGGCPVAALGAESVRQSPQIRAAMTEGLRRQIERLAQGTGDVDPEAARRAAIGQWSALVGALVLARLSDDPALSEEVLGETRAWLGGPSS